jgi:hypothetical protein
MRQTLGATQSLRNGQTPAAQGHLATESEPVAAIHGAPVRGAAPGRNRDILVRRVASDCAEALAEPMREELSWDCFGWRHGPR